MRIFRTGLFLLILFALYLSAALAQVENVPVSNQVYEFLNRMGVKGVLPLYDNAMIPLSRREVANDLLAIDKSREQLSSAEQQFLDKFEQEFMHEIDPSRENPTVLLSDGFDGFFSDREKYLYRYNDSNVTSYIQFLGTLDYRRIDGDTYGGTHVGFEQHGGRIRGTVKDKLGYYLQATDGTLYGDRSFALEDPYFRGSVKFNNLNSPYFDFTEGYVRLDFDWIGLQFGREHTLVGTGYSDRLILSDNAPVTDFIKLDVHYKTLRYLFMQSSLVSDSSEFLGLIQQEPPGSNKYLALHRLEFSLFDRLTLGASEMIIYQRFSPDFGYLNPANFYKSTEHSLGDRDNAFLVFDAQLFAAANYKLYGTWLIDDIDFSRLGTNWWGNEFGLQAGLFTTGLAGISNLDGALEYTKIDPYVYSNRVAGNDFTNDNISLGHHLPPNSDEWFLQFQYRPAKLLRTWLTYAFMRHGDNIVVNGDVIRNVGGDVLQGHRDTDSEEVTFLDGILTKRHAVQLRVSYEFVTDFILTGLYEYRRTLTPSSTLTDHFASVQLQVEY